MKITVMHYDSVASTNDEAASLARMGGPEGLCVVAGEQTAGRGREGRKWLSPPGAGLYFSVVLRPTVEPRFFSVIPLLGAVAVYDTLEQSCGVKPDIKWPNDLLIEEKKISGILTETCETSKGLAVILGIGINLTTEGLVGEIGDSATSIKDVTKSEADFESLLRALTFHVSRNFDELNSAEDVKNVLDAWSSRSSFHSGKRVAVKTRRESLEGTTEGLDPLGSLLVRLDDGVLKTITAGDVESLRGR